MSEILDDYMDDLHRGLAIVERNSSANRIPKDDGESDIPDPNGLISSVLKYYDPDKEDPVLEHNIRTAYHWSLRYRIPITEEHEQKLSAMVDLQKIKKEVKEYEDELKRRNPLIDFEQDDDIEENAF